MKSKFFSATLVLTCLGALAVPALAQSEPGTPDSVQQVAPQVAPQIDSFTVRPIAQLTPGNELVFTLQGTPNAAASFTIGNLANNVPMREVEPGVYEGRYTIRTGDQISDNTIVRANLAKGDQISSVRLQDTLVADSGSNNQVPSISRFSVEPFQSLEPGTTLTFTLLGTPNAQATFTIDGVAYQQPMQEIRSGTYQGEYVIRRQDDFPAGTVNITAQLDANGQIVRSRLDQPLAAINPDQIPLQILSPTNNSRVAGPIEVTGRSSPQTTINVNVTATNSVAGVIGINRDMLNRNVQSDAQGNFSFQFNPTIAIPGTRYEISLSAVNGNQSNEQTLVIFQQ